MNSKVKLLILVISSCLFYSKSFSNKDLATTESLNKSSLLSTTLTDAKNKDFYCPPGIATTSTYFMPHIKDYCAENLESCPKFESAVKTQGSGILAEGKTKKYVGNGNFETKTYDDCKTTKVQDKHCLIPYISIAADIIRLDKKTNKWIGHYHRGDIIEMPALRGETMTFADGTNFKHPGFLIVQDSGGDIDGEGRFDFFTHSLSPDKKLNSMGSTSKYKISDRTECKGKNYTVIKINKNIKKVSGQSKEYQNAFNIITEFEKKVLKKKSLPSQKLKGNAKGNQ
jgi:hypothetical protein